MVQPPPVLVQLFLTVNKILVNTIRQGLKTPAFFVFAHDGIIKVMKKILIACPTPDLVKISFVENLLAIILKAQKLDGVDINFSYKTGVRTDRNRNELVKLALENSMDYILWLDTDMLYPVNIVEKLLGSDKDIIGVLYYKRAEPYTPIGSYKSKKKEFSYNPLDPTTLPVDSVIEVDGLGFGGMMVKTSVYDKMGEDKWCKYGDQYHIPVEGGNHLTHDFEFCRKAQEHGIHIYLHTGIKPGHLTEMVVDERFYLGYKGLK